MFWTRVVGWAADNRVFVGAESVRSIWGWLAEKGYPESELDVFPAALRNEYRQALNKILSRVVCPASETGARTLDPSYCGPAGLREALELDISGSSGSGIGAIASAQSFWSYAADEVFVSPPPPSRLALCFEPGATLAVELADRIREKFSEKKLIIIGGQPSDRVLDEIRHATGISRRSITWIASERSKKPRDLDRRLAKLDPCRDIVICVTGQIGHAESEAAATAAAKAGVAYFPIENRNDIANRLISKLAG
jgi:hypothetical protein